MSDKTKIEWTASDDGTPGSTWNPIVGCTHVSPGCDHCYAAAVTHTRLQGIPLYTGLTVRNGDEPPRFTGEVRYAPERLLWPLTKQRPRRIFVNSVSDLFHAGVEAGVVDQVWAVMALAHHHQFQILTKRPQAMHAYLTAHDTQPHVANAMDRIRVMRESRKHGKRDSLFPIKWPLPNVWLGTSIESGTWSWRARHLRTTPAAVRFLSIEPLIAPIGDLDLAGIRWVIIGGESQHGARPMDPDWARDVITQCREQDVAVFFKQAGSELARQWGLAGTGHDWTDPRFPDEFKVREYPQPAEEWDGVQ